ncbi:MAG: hypothetical protein CM15mP51_06760 [Porticoccaceae bacterium]|nr:MAG: hypothetical protein CM15mP51_06760 [Porticoccaceae bacterium]
MGGNVVAAVKDIGEQPAIEDLIGGIKVMLKAYDDNEIDQLFLVSNEFVNTMTQSPRVEQLLPLEPVMKRDFLIIGIIYMNLMLKICLMVF